MSGDGLTPAELLYINSEPLSLVAVPVYSLEGKSAALRTRRVLLPPLCSSGTLSTACIAPSLKQLRRLVQIERGRSTRLLSRHMLPSLCAHASVPLCGRTCLSKRPDEERRIRSRKPRWVADELVHHRAVLDFDSPVPPVPHSIPVRLWLWLQHFAAASAPAAPTATRLLAGDFYRACTTLPPHPQQATPNRNKGHACSLEPLRRVTLGTGPSS